MAIYDELQEASVILGAAGLAGTGVSAGQLSDILNRLTALEAIAVPPSQIILAGRRYGPLTTISGNPPATPVEMVANRLYAVPFHCPQDASFDEVGFTVSTAVAGAAVRAGIYASGPAGIPDALVADLGAVDASAVGFRPRTISQTLPRGRYWLAGASNVVGLFIETVVATTGTTAILGHPSTSGNFPRSSLFRAAELAAGFTTLPTTFGGMTTHSNIQVFWLKAV